MSPTLFKELDNVTAVFHEALDNYINTYAKLRDHQFQKDSTDNLVAILHRVADELQLITSCGTKLKRVEESMKAVRNSTSTIVPISSLPPEIMTQIFYIVFNNQQESFDTTHAPSMVSLSFPKYPETLSHVCSGWRRIAIASNILWTRIDLALHHPLGPGFLDRAKTQVHRAGALPLDIRLIDPPSNLDHTRYSELDRPKDLDFLTSPQTPIRTLSLVSYCGLQLEHYNFIFYCISNCAQQTLEKLVIWDVCGYGSPQCFIEPAHNPRYPRSLHIELSEKTLEGVWCSTSVLNLAGIYPYWSSRAYHRLVDLRLGFGKTGGRVSVSEAEVVNILKASPGLRVFHFHLHLTDPLPDDAPILPVRLDELESVNLSSAVSSPSQILRYITPGRKPLQLSIFGRPTDVVEHFIRRSNVTQLRMIGWGEYLPANALRLCPNIRVLVLDAWTGADETSLQTIPEQGVEGAEDIPRCIPTLYLLRCQVTISFLQNMVETHSVQELTLWKTRPTILGGHNWEFQTAYESEIESLCPVVNYLEGGVRSPVDEWDFF